MGDGCEARRDHLGGQLTEGAEARAGGNAGEKAICKRYENPTPAGGRIENCHKNGAGSDDAGGGVVHLIWKAE